MLEWADREIKMWLKGWLKQWYVGHITTHYSHVLYTTSLFNTNQSLHNQTDFTVIVENNENEITVQRFLLSVYKTH